MPPGAGAEWQVSPMSPRWRYRTPVLLGPWKSTVGEAAESAIFRGLADRDESQPHGLRWRVPGCLEGDRGESQADDEGRKDSPQGDQLF